MGCGGSVGKKKRRKRRPDPRSSESGPYDEEPYMDDEEADDSFAVGGFAPPAPPDDNEIRARNLPSGPTAHDQISYTEASSRAPYSPGAGIPNNAGACCSRCQQTECTCPKSDCKDECEKPECCEECGPDKECECEANRPPPDHAFADGYNAEKRNVASKSYRPDAMELQVGKTVIASKITIQIQQNGRNGAVNVVTNTTDTVFELRFHIFEATRILPSNQILMCNGRDLPLEKQLGECGVVDRSILELTDHGEAITEYIIEITDAMKVRELKQDLRKLETELREAKKRSADKLRQNDWEGTDQMVQQAQVLERKKQRRQKELEEIHEKHKQGFRQLHVKIMRLFSEKRKSSAEYARLKRELLSAVQRNEVLRSTEIVNDLMVQFIRHDGCERELMLLDAFVPDMVEASAEQRADDDLSDVDEEPVVDPRKPAPRRSYQEQPAPPAPYRQQPSAYGPRGYQPEQYPAQAPPKQPYYGNQQAYPAGGYGNRPNNQPNYY